jgi:hypothetical protein
MLSNFVLFALLAAQTGQDSLLRLPVRFHLLHSATSTNISTSRTGATVDTLVAFANRIWRQAGIEFVVESVITEDAPNGAILDSMIRGAVPRTPDPLIAFVPRERLLVPGWNIFLIRDFGPIAGGMFRPELLGAVLAERGFGYELPADGRGGGTLAHEFGHSLGLPHETCDETRNIMANACSRPGVISTLNATQVLVARRQAAAGRPTTEMPSP